VPRQLERPRPEKQCCGRCPRHRSAATQLRPGTPGPAGSPNQIPGQYGRSIDPIDIIDITETRRLPAVGSCPTQTPEESYQRSSPGVALWVVPRSFHARSRFPRRSHTPRRSLERVIPDTATPNSKDSALKTRFTSNSRKQPKTSVNPENQRPGSVPNEWQARQGSRERDFWARNTFRRDLWLKGQSSAP
jgi:hypothetical protein